MAVGFATGKSFDRNRTNWDGDGPRPLVWSAWYPAADDALERPSHTRRSWFRSAPIARNAALRASDDPHPLVLLSHGTGGVAAGLAWLGHRLAQRGFVALAVNHHGNTAAEPYRPEGFLCLWERAADLAALLDDRGWRRKLGGAVRDDAFVAGFSAGGYAAMIAIGARIAQSQFEPGFPVNVRTRGPKEFPDLADHLPDLLAHNPIFRRSWGRRTADFSDRRFRAALVLAPGRSVLGFLPASLAQIDTPVRIVACDADAAAPAVECAGWLHGQIRGSGFEMLRGGLGHYVFLPEGTPAGLAAEPSIFTDPPGVDRRVVHDRIAASAAAVFGRA